MFCILYLDQYQHILQAHKEPSTQTYLKKKKKKKKVGLGILRLLLSISHDQHLAGLSKTFSNISAMGFLELHNYSTLQPAMGRKKHSSGIDKMVMLQEYSNTKLGQQPNISDSDCYILLPAHNS